MRVALFLKQDPKEGVENTGKVVVFTVKENKVVGVENDTVDIEKSGHLSLWALTKKIDEIYIPVINDSIEKLFLSLGITLKSYEELAEDQLFKNYIVC
ncbi:MAG: hypothetical protein LIP06_00700 [Tannerellaceae bacterium]|nr:hypothetical protein [Tannerellaceae bacterium]